MRRDDPSLADIVKAASTLSAFLQGLTEQQFLASDLHQSAVVHQLTIIGEASARLTSATRKAMPAIQWPDVISMRNFVVHAYFAISWKIVYLTATQDVPELLTQVAEHLDDLYPS